MPASRSAVVDTSYTKRVLDALVQFDDFMSLDMLQAATKLQKRQLRPTLGWLHKAKAVDSVESGGLLFWYATPESDTRLRTTDEHLREDEPRAPRRARGKVKE